MGQLMKYSLIAKIKNFDMVFWPLLFPLVMATLFYLAFGRIEEADFSTVPVAVVKEAEQTPETEIFLTFLGEMEQSESGLLAVEEMTEEEAKEALSVNDISGIFYVGKEIRLSVRQNGFAQSILESLLESYENGRQTLLTVAKTHPLGMVKAVEEMENYGECVRQISLGGRTTNGNAQFFYALIAMACLYGMFIGSGAALSLQANLQPFAARRSVSATPKRTLIFVEMGSSCLIHVCNVLVLIFYIRFVLGQELGGSMVQTLLVAVVGSIIGVSMGIFVGSVSKFGEGTKIAILLGISMTCSFLAGLMNGDMKYVVEKSFPLINRINPAALISDALYCIHVYEDPGRLTKSLLTLGVIALALLILSVVKTRRERYDSI